MLQTCRTCQAEKPLDAFELRKDTQRYRTICKACRNQKIRERYAENPEPWLRSGKKWREENREQHRTRARKYAAANKERMNETSRRWVRENSALVCARSIEWRKANRERVREAAKALRLADPEKFRTVVRNRRAKMQVSGEHTAADIAKLWEAQAARCNGCGCDLNESGYHVDHVEPIAKGGSNGPENLQLLCPTCNLSKGTKSMSEWRKVKGYD